MDKQYIFVHEHGIIALENEINRKFGEGYLPDGNVVVSHNGDKNNGSPIFIQKMVKKPQSDSYGYEKP